MRSLQLQGVIERRLLVNYRVDADIAARLVPAPFRPQLVDGSAVAGICLIRLGELRPKGLPRRLGLRSENAAHRISVEWDTVDGPQAGVYIPRRDSASWLNTVGGGRLFPGEHRRARFQVTEDAERLHVAFRSLDGTAAVDVSARVAADLDSSLFASLETASDFFRSGAIGYSATRDCDRLDGVELHTNAWRVVPAQVEQAQSSFFDDPERFPPGSAVLDSALLMRAVPVTWHPLPVHERVERLSRT